MGSTGVLATKFKPRKFYEKPIFFKFPSGDFMGANISGAIHGDSQEVIIRRPASPLLLTGRASPLRTSRHSLSYYVAPLCSHYKT
jgi:hypothetical protein